jgi:class 3 adenylate cyclase
MLGLVGVAPATRYAKCGHLVIAYQDGGGDGVPVVWVPGFVSHVEIQRELPCLYGFTERVERFARLITFDKRGTGLSDRSLGVGTLEDRMDDIRAVYDACDLDRANIVAVSEGGPLAVLFAATYPERVDHLVLYGSYAYGSRPADAVSAAASAMEAGWGTGFMAGSVVQHVDEGARAALARFERYACTPSMVAEKSVSDAALDVRGVLGVLDVPTLVLHNLGDPFVSIEASRVVADGIPNARFIEMDGDFHASWRPDDYDELVGHIEEFVTGTRVVENRSDRVLTTVLFSDIVGSTAQAADFGDRQWRHVLDDHDQVVRAELNQYRGREISTTGDGFFAAFDGPARAVRCGVAITEAVRRLGVEVRVGVHTGECEARGTDLAGIAVHIGARVASLAAPGEVLVTSTVRDLVAGSGLRFEQRGAHQLKGVPDAWNIFAVDHTAQT